MEFSNYDTRHYKTLPVQEGYREWVKSYDDVVLGEMVFDLMDSVHEISWNEFLECDVLDLACGTGRIGAWLNSKGIKNLTGLDLTHEMLEKAKALGIYKATFEADMTRTNLPQDQFALVTNVLSDEHIPDLKPLHAEVARILMPGGFYLSISFHPHFLLNGIPTHFDNESGESIAVKSYVHLMSDHFHSGKAAGLELIEFNERIVDDAWVEKIPRWKKHHLKPISYSMLWRKL